MRAFICIDLPDSIKDSLEKTAAGLGMPGLAAVKRPAMHITLQFLGEISEAEAENAKLAIMKLASRPINVSIKGISYFSQDPIRVVYASISKGSEELKRLYYELNTLLAKEGFNLHEERKEYTPHVTLFRVKDAYDRKRLVGSVSRHKETEFGSFKADAVLLKRSVLGPLGPSYTSLYEHKI